MMSAQRILIASGMLLAMLLSGCGGTSPEGRVQESALESTIVEPRTGAKLMVMLDQDSIQLTETLTIRALLQWDDGVRVELIQPNWEELGWTLESERGGAVTFDGERFVREDVFVASPFLGGEYLVDGFGIRAGTAEIGKRIARLAPIEVLVESVLSENDGSELEGEVLLAEMPQEQTTDDHAGVIAIIAGAFVVIGCLAVWYIRRTHEDEVDGMDPASVLLIAAHAEQLNDEDIGRLHRALIELNAQYAGIGVIAREVESARFCGHTVDAAAVRDAARRAVEICGVAG